MHIEVQYFSFETNSNVLVFSHKSLLLLIYFLLIRFFLFFIEKNYINQNNKHVASICSVEFLYGQITY